MTQQLVEAEKEEREAKAFAENLGLTPARVKEKFKTEQSSIVATNSFNSKPTPGSFMVGKTDNRNLTPEELSLVLQKQYEPSTEKNTHGYNLKKRVGSVAGHSNSFVGINEKMNDFNGFDKPIHKSDIVNGHSNYNNNNNYNHRHVDNEKVNSIEKTNGLVSVECHNNSNKEKVPIWRSPRMSKPKNILSINGDKSTCDNRHSNPSLFSNKKRKVDDYT